MRLYFEILLGCKDKHFLYIRTSYMKISSSRIICKSSYNVLLTYNIKKMICQYPPHCARFAPLIRGYRLGRPPYRGKVWDGIRTTSPHCARFAPLIRGYKLGLPLRGKVWDSIRATSLRCGRKRP